MLLILLIVTAWCVVPLPLAVAVGRAFGAVGHGTAPARREDLDLVTRPERVGRTRQAG